MPPIFWPINMLPECPVSILPHTECWQNRYNSDAWRGQLRTKKRDRWLTMIGTATLCEIERRHKIWGFYLRREEKTKWIMLQQPGLSLHRPRGQIQLHDTLSAYRIGTVWWNQIKTGKRAGSMLCPPCLCKVERRHRSQALSTKNVEEEWCMSPTSQPAAQQSDTIGSKRL